MQLPTRDTPPLSVRQLLSHSAGFPEDNPWGDQQLSATDETLLDVLAALTPEERLRWNDRMATTIQELRHGFAAAQPDDAAREARGERD